MASSDFVSSLLAISSPIQQAGIAATGNSPNWYDYLLSPFNAGEQVSGNLLDQAMQSPNANYFLQGTVKPPSPPSNEALATGDATAIFNSTINYPQQVASTYQGMSQAADYSEQTNPFATGVSLADSAGSLFSSGIVDPITGSINWKGIFVVAGLAVGSLFVIKLMMK